MLKKKHSKTGEDSKYSSTVLGRGNVGNVGSAGDHEGGAGTGSAGDILVEGGDCPSIALWQEKRIEARQRPRPPTPPRDERSDDDDEMRDDGDEGGHRYSSRSPSSGLSSLGDGVIDEEMELEFGVS